MTPYQEIKNSLVDLYQIDERPWLVGFSGGKDSTMLASLVFDAVLSLTAEKREKPISILCTDTRVEIPAIVEMVEGTLDKMRKCSDQYGLNIEANLLRPPAEQSFWVNIIGRGYPPPNRSFRWCTQRMKIDPVNVLCSNDWDTGARRFCTSVLVARKVRRGLKRSPALKPVMDSGGILISRMFGCQTR